MELYDCSWGCGCLNNKLSQEWILLVFQCELVSFSRNSCNRSKSQYNPRAIMRSYEIGVGARDYDERGAKGCCIGSLADG